MVCLNPFLPILDFFDFCRPVQSLEKSWNFPPNFAGFWAKSGNFKDISLLLHRSKEVVLRGVYTNRQKSKSVKMCLNKPKQSQKVASVPPQAAPGRYRPYRHPLRGSQKWPLRAPRNPRGTVAYDPVISTLILAIYRVNHASHQGFAMDLKPLYMYFYDSYGVFKPIFTDFGFF